VKTSLENSFQIRDDEIVVIEERVCIPDNKALKEEILKEAYKSKFNIHPGSTKMYKNLKEFYWWPKMKNEVVEYVAKCSICQHVKDEH
jgi:xanthine dehydrogenase molybdopterin-binding subunit B